MLDDERLLAVDEAMNALAGAEALFRETLAEVKSHDIGASAYAIFPNFGLAETYAVLARVEEAERHYRAALAAARDVHDEYHNAALQSEARLGAYLHATSRRAEGRPLLEDVAHKIDPASHQYVPGFVVAVISGVRGAAMLAEGRLAQADELIGIDVDDAHAHFPGSVPLAVGLRRLAAVRTAQGRYAESARMLDEALGIWIKVSGTAADPATRNAYLIEQARLQVAQGQPLAALEIAQKVARPKDIERRPLWVDGAHAQVIVADVYLQQNRFEEAVANAQEALERVEQSSARSYFQTLEADAALRLGESLRRGGEPKRGRPYLERALHLREANDDAASPWLAQAQIALGRCLIDIGERHGATLLLAKAKAAHATHASLGLHFTSPLTQASERLALR